MANSLSMVCGNEALAWASWASTFPNWSRVITSLASNSADRIDISDSSELNLVSSSPPADWAVASFCLANSSLVLTSRSKAPADRLHGLIILTYPSLRWGLFRHPEQGLQMQPLPALMAATFVDSDGKEPRLRSTARQPQRTMLGPVVRTLPPAPVHLSSWPCLPY